MSGRLGLLAVLRAAVVAGTSSAPSPTPSETPSELGSMLPLLVGDITMDIGPRPASDMWSAEALDDLLAALGSEPSELRVAHAWACAEDGAVPLYLRAIRVHGASGQAVVDTLTDLDFQVGPTIPPHISFGWQDVLGKRVRVMTRDDMDGWGFYYPKDDVAFVGTYLGDDPGVTVEDVLTELP